MMGGLFIVISQTNLVKKLVGLAIFQTSVFLFYISAGKIAGGTRRSLPVRRTRSIRTRFRMS